MSPTNLDRGTAFLFSQKILSTPFMCNSSVAGDFLLNVTVLGAADIQLYQSAGGSGGSSQQAITGTKHTEEMWCCSSV